MGQVPRSSGMTQVGPALIGPWGSQQIIPAPQHIVPQHDSASVHFASHGTSTQLPPVQ